METQTGPQKDRTEKICIIILADKVRMNDGVERAEKNNYEIQQTMKEHKSRGAVWCVTHL